jgi:hypothetical protein
LTKTVHVCRIAPKFSLLKLSKEKPFFIARYNTQKEKRKIISLLILLLLHNQKTKKKNLEPIIT